MLRLPVTFRTAFCILLNICLPLSSTTTYLILSLRPFEYPPRTSITILLQYIISKPGCCILSSMRSGAYFKVFSSSFCWWFSTQRQPISKGVFLLLSLSTILASSLVALTSVWSAYTGTSQKAVMWLFSCIGLDCVVLSLLLLSLSLLLLMWSTWNNSFLNCGCRWKWRMIITVNFPI